MKVLFDRRKMEMVAPDKALPGRPTPLPTAERHFLSGIALKSPVPDGFEQAMFGMGCFWGVERKFYNLRGVWLTMTGYAAGFTPNPTYPETCTQMTGHNEVVRVIFDPAVISYETLLKTFWEGHDPTQGMRQGNDVGNKRRQPWPANWLTKARLRQRATGPSPPKSCPHRCFTMPRITISNILRKTPTATAAWVARGSAAPSDLR